MGQHLDFKEIVQAMSGKFKDVLDALNIPYTVANNGTIKGEGFIITGDKYTNPVGKDYGNCLNFLVNKKGMEWREAAIFIRDNFLVKKDPPAPELPDYILEYTKELSDLGISEDTAKKLGIGKIKNKGYNAGLIGFTACNIENVKVGYIVFDAKKQEWKPIKQLKHDFLYNLNRTDKNKRWAVLFSDPINTALHFEVCQQVIGMTRGTITEAQLNLIKERFDHLIVIHHDPKQVDYLVNKLSKFLFVVATTGSQEDFDKFAHLLAMSKN